jgi:hypothetical protein
LFLEETLLKLIHSLLVLFCVALSCPGGEARAESVSVSELTYFVHQEDTGGCGSAFLFEDTNGVWLVSNVHVFSGSTNLSLININGNKLEVPTQIEVAKDRDIIRFRTDQPQGLHLSSSCNFEDPISAYGDSGGAGVLTKLDGKIVAPGPDRVEISAPIIPGNSGGPVVNAAGEVVGVSSYIFRNKLPDWISDGTRFADTRRMALRLNDVEWISTDFSEFYKQTSALREFDESLNTAIYIAVVLSDDLTHKMMLTTEQRGFQSWLKKHNRYADANQERSLKNNIKSLARMLQRIEGDPTSGCEITIPFLQGKLADMTDACEAARKQTEALSN